MTAVAPQNHNDGAFDLATWLGRRQAFSLIAGTCAAADARSLCFIRAEKKYRSLGMTWEQFCKQKLGLHRSKADEIIRLWEQFGASYFTLAQTTGIKPDEYRAIAPSISGQTLVHQGEAIPIEVEQGPRLLAAVQDLTKVICIEAGPVEKHPVPDVESAFRNTARLLRAAVKSLERLRGMSLDMEGRSRFKTLAGSAWLELKEIESSVKV